MQLDGQVLFVTYDNSTHLLQKPSYTILQEELQHFQIF